MNNNFSYDRYAAARTESRVGSRQAAWAMVAACLLAPVCAGCQSSGQATPHCPPFEYLEQGCFGYEPTIWRTMPGDCQQAIRLIPDPKVDVPKPAGAAESPDKAPPATPEESTGPDQPTLNDVPDRAPVDLPDMMEPPVEQPTETPGEPAEATPPSVSPSAVPDVPPASEPGEKPPAKTRPETEDQVEPKDQTEAKKPTRDEPRENAPAAAEPKKTAPPKAAEKPEPNQATPAEPKKPTPADSGTSKPAEAQPPVSSSPDQLPPTLNGPVAQASASKGAARALFRTVSRALRETDQGGDDDARSHDDQPAVGLSRFISY
ncbi:MAG: hypothetical protein ACQESR_06345 [Planctomycetota bacterium]